MRVAGTKTYFLERRVGGGGLSGDDDGGVGGEGGSESAARNAAPQRVTHQLRYRFRTLI